MKNLEYLKYFENFNSEDEFKIGDKVKIISDNESYEDYVNETLIIDEIYHNEDENPLYDMGIYPDLLFDLTIENGDDFPYSLYEYEVVKIN